MSSRIIWAQPESLPEKTTPFVASHDYAPFGNTIASSGASGLTYRYTGQEYDAEIGLHNYRARFYDSNLGRFYAMDPAGQFWSPYAYAGNPLLYTDPNGLWFGIDDLIVSGVAFTVGYLQHGISTGDWGGDAFAAGGIAAGSAWLAYNTGGAAAGQLFAEGSAGYAITASTVGGAVGGATSSFGNQLYNTGRVDYGQIGTAAGYGAIGGLAGGVTGQYITSDPVLGSMISGSIVGGIQGGVEGAFMGAFWGGVDASLTAISYEQYGKYIKNRHFSEGVCNEWSCHVFRENLLAKLGEEKYVMFQSAYENPVDVPMFDMKKGDLSWLNSHSGISLGRDKFGQHYILSKLNVNQPVTVKTGRHFLNLYKGAHLNLSGYGYVRTVNSRMIFN